jgi:hypothetical protein
MKRERKEGGEKSFLFQSDVLVVENFMARHKT